MGGQNHNLYRSGLCLSGLPVSPQHPEQLLGMAGAREILMGQMGWDGIGWARTGRMGRSRMAWGGAVEFYRIEVN